MRETFDNCCFNVNLILLTMAAIQTIDNAADQDYEENLDLIGRPEPAAERTTRLSPRPPPLGRTGSPLLNNLHLPLLPVNFRYMLFESLLGQPKPHPLKLT